MGKLKYFGGMVFAALVSLLNAAPAYAAAIQIPNAPVSLREPVTIDEFTPFIQGLKALGMVGMGVCVLITLTMLVISITKLSLSAGNEHQRSRAIKGILICGIALALFGGAGLLVSISAGVF